MAAWRRRALELFPRLRRDLTGPDCTSSGLWEAMVSPTEWARIAPRLEAKRAAGERQTVRGLGPAGVTGRLNIRLEKHPWQTSMWSR